MSAASEHAIEAWARAAERARIVEALATIHKRCIYHNACRMCDGCGKSLDSDGDCPTMRIAKGKA